MRNADVMIVQAAEAQDLEATFDKLNRELFDGRLLRPREFVRDRRRSPVMSVHYTLDSKTGRPKEIRMLRASTMYRYTDEQWINLVAHEMIHIDVSWKDYGSHGPLFRSRCDKIRRQTGGRIAPPYRHVENEDLLPARTDASKSYVLLWLDTGRGIAIAPFSPAVLDKNAEAIARRIDGLRKRNPGRKVGLMKSTSGVLDQFPTVRKFDGAKFTMYHTSDTQWTDIEQNGTPMPDPISDSSAVQGLAEILPRSLASRLIVTAAAVPKISLAEAQQRGMFGPCWHGTTAEAREQISRGGFRISERPNDSRHGYAAVEYVDGLPPPIHHLGFGVYFTTSKTIAKQYNQNSTRGLTTYYLDVPRLKTINFGSPRTMMRWWQENGYDPRIAREDRAGATRALTEHLKQRYDAVWFRGKGLTRLLDGDQIVVFDTARIYEIDAALAAGFEPGARIRRRSDGLVGVIVRKEQDVDYEALTRMWRERGYDGPHPWARPEMKAKYTVRWRRGGTQYGVADLDIEPVVPDRAGAESA